MRKYCKKFFALLHRSEQYLTSSQSFSHFLRHVKGFLQTGQIFSGKFSFFTPLGIVITSTGQRGQQMSCYSGTIRQCFCVPYARVKPHAVYLRLRT